MATTSTSTALRLREDDRAIIKALSQATGLDMTSVIRVAIRESATSRGIPLPVAHVDDEPPTPEEPKRPRGRPKKSSL